MSFHDHLYWLAPAGAVIRPCGPELKLATVDRAGDFGKLHACGVEFAFVAAIRADATSHARPLNATVCIDEIVPR